MSLIFKCPYCFTNKKSRDNKDFESWESVKKHAGICSLNNKSYVIFREYGPLSTLHINSFETISQFKKQYPLIVINTSAWEYYRQNYNLTLSKGITWTKSEIIKKILEANTTLGKPPEARETRCFKNFPSVSTIQTRFGSWNKAIIAAGLQPTYSDSFGIPTIAQDGKVYRSMAEAKFVNKYLFGKYNYQYELPYGNGWFYDFYIIDKDLYIELDGNCRPKRIKEKVEFNLKYNINCKVISTSEIDKGNIII